ncbi:MAG: tetratricopeptide repeat protein [Chloroflexota bacterium]|nr:tetratricopeptide repeat protein [Chloroflexota bacterium]
MPNSRQLSGGIVIVFLLGIWAWVQFVYLRFIVSLQIEGIDSAIYSILSTVFAFSTLYPIIFWAIRDLVQQQKVFVAESTIPTQSMPPHLQPVGRAIGAYGNRIALLLIIFLVNLSLLGLVSAFSRFQIVQSGPSIGLNSAQPTQPNQQFPDQSVIELQALVDEARQHMEDAQRYAGDASNFLGLFEALGLTVTLGGALLAGIGVLRLVSAENELQKTRERFEDALNRKEEELEVLKSQLREQAQQQSLRIEQERRNVEAAVSNATLALALLPLGERQYKAQDYDGALDTYKRALALDDQNPVTHLRLGYVSTQAGKLEEARQYLTKALQIDPQLTPAIAALGYVYRRIGENMAQGIERDEMLLLAESKLIEALKMSPKLVDDDGESWWGSLGGLYRRRGQIEQAINAYEKAAKVTPHSSYPFSNLALLYMQAGNSQKMMQTYKRVERLAKGETQAEIDNYWAYSDMLASQLAQSKMNEIDDSLQSVLETAPASSPYVLTTLIDTLTRLTTALGGEEKASHIKPVIDKLQVEIARREAASTPLQPTT